MKRSDFDSDFLSDESSRNLQYRTAAEVFDDLLMLLCTVAVCVCIGTDERVIRWILNLFI